MTPREEAERDPKVRQISRILLRMYLGYLVLFLLLIWLKASPWLILSVCISGLIAAPVMLVVFWVAYLDARARVSRRRRGLEP